MSFLPICSDGTSAGFSGGNMLMPIDTVTVQIESLLKKANFKTSLGG